MCHGSSTDSNTHTDARTHAHTLLVLIPAVHLLPPWLLGLSRRSVEGLHPLLPVLLLVRPKLVARVVLDEGKLQLCVLCTQESRGHTHIAQT